MGPPRRREGREGGGRFATRQLLIIHAHLLSAAGRSKRGERKRVRVGEGAAHEMSAKMMEPVLFYNVSLKIYPISLSSTHCRLDFI